MTKPFSSKTTQHVVLRTNNNGYKCSASMTQLTSNIRPICPRFPLSFVVYPLSSGSRRAENCTQTSVIPFGHGSKLNHQGTAGVGPCFHLPGFHFRYIFLTHSHFLNRLSGAFRGMAPAPCAAHNLLLGLLKHSLSEARRGALS